MSESGYWATLLPEDKEGTAIALGDIVYGEDEKAWKIEGVGTTFVWGRRISNEGDIVGSKHKRLRVEWLTHKRPKPKDTWALVEKEAEYQPWEYNLVRDLDVDFSKGQNATKVMTRDLVRRCKALSRGAKNED